MNRRATIEKLRRLAERPGTVHEGDVARRMLEKLGAQTSCKVTTFNPLDWPNGSRVFYNYWAYSRNDPAVIAAGRNNQIIQMNAGKPWMRLKFDRLKQARWVPVTSQRGCHLSANQLSDDEAEFFYFAWLSPDGDTPEACWRPRRVDEYPMSTE